MMNVPAGTRPPRVRDAAPSNLVTAIQLICIAAITLIGVFSSSHAAAALLLGLYALYMAGDRWYWRRRCYRAEYAAAERSSWDEAAAPFLRPLNGPDPR
jgi:hypothetical protein